MKRCFGLLGVVLFACMLSVAAADDHPNGCVSCHVKGDGAEDIRLNVILAELGHGRGGERTKLIPTGCNRCHAPDGDGTAGAIQKLVHAVHYESPTENAYMLKYGGDCRDCHNVDGPSGKATIKVGERNWELRVADTPIPEAVAPDAE
jgi:hypothetical protein